MHSQAFIWLIVVVVLLLIEAMTMGLTTIWFAGGGMVAFVASLFGADFLWQLILFLLVSTVLLILTRPLVVKKMKKNHFKTNVDAMAGKIGVVIEKVDDIEGTGKIKVDGTVWTARSMIAGDIIEIGTKVQVEAVQGVKAMVVKIKE
ncbi:MAG: NfeD family protein [Lachnospiraceae bacterium]|jgi:membrane protein implicated in regulation of membrane protease activity|nr:NfeD family protein [Lachnospiraceae bacterium]